MTDDAWKRYEKRQLKRLHDQLGADAVDFFYQRLVTNVSERLEMKLKQEIEQLRKDLIRQLACSKSICWQRMKMAYRFFTPRSTKDQTVAGTNTTKETTK